MIPHLSEKGYTSTNDRTNLVPINHLLVKNLLPYRTKVIDCARPQSVGVYQSVHARIDLAEEGYPIILVFIT